MVGCLLIVGAAERTASQATGRIAGWVTDSSGATITGAEVTAVSKATSGVWEISTDRGGHYAFLVLPPGAYDITVGAKGF